MASMLVSWVGARLAKATLILAVVATAATAPAGCGGDAAPGRPVKVYTRNLYLGAALTGLVAVPSPAEVPAAAVELWGVVKASNFPERAKLIAADIVAAAPDLVALQEVTLYRTQTPSDYQASAPAVNADHVELDFLASVMAELGARGASYRVVVEAFNADAELPVDDGAGGLFDLRVTDRDVMLVRDGVTAANPLVTPFEDAFALNVGGVGGVPVRFMRSTSRVEVGVDGAALTFATGHLEVQILTADQMSQAHEMIASLGGVTGPVVLAGDFNSAPGRDSYSILVPPFRDAGTILGSGPASFTCCQGDNLANPVSSADQRIDLVLYRGGVSVKSVEVRGSDPATGRTPGGLWASDHFGVLANLEL